MTRKLKITAGKYEACHHSWEISSVYVNGSRTVAEIHINPNCDEDNQDEYESIKDADAEFIAEAFNVANETDLMPRELLAQRDELLAALEAVLNERPEVCLMCSGRGEIGGFSRCEPGGHSEPCPDCNKAVEAAKAAIARVRGEP